MQGRLTCAALALRRLPPARHHSQPQQPTFRLEANYVRVDLYAIQGDAAF